MVIPWIAISSLLLAFIGALAILGSLPGIARLLVYLRYQPDLIIAFESPFQEKEPIEWHELSTNVGDSHHRAFNVISRTEKDLTIVLEFNLTRPWMLQQNSSKRVADESIGGIHGFRTRIRPQVLPSKFNYGTEFPYEPEPEDCTLTVAVYPTVHLSEFKIPFLNHPLPRYFGEVDLRRIEEEFEILGEE